MKKNYFLIFGLLVLSINSDGAGDEVPVRESRGLLARFGVWVTSCCAPDRNVVTAAMTAQRPPRTADPQAKEKEPAASRRGRRQQPDSLASTLSASGASESVAETERSPDRSEKHISPGFSLQSLDRTQAENAVAEAMLAAPSHHSEASNEEDEGEARSVIGRRSRAFAIGGSDSEEESACRPESRQLSHSASSLTRSIERSAASRRTVAAALASARVDMGEVYALLGEEEHEQERLADRILKTPYRALREIHPDWSHDQIQAALGNKEAVRRLHPGWSDARIRQFVRNTAAPVSAAAIAALDGETGKYDVLTPRGISEDEEEDDLEEERLEDVPETSGSSRSKLPRAAWAEESPREKTLRFSRVAGRKFQAGDGSETPQMRSNREAEDEEADDEEALPAAASPSYEEVQETLEAQDVFQQGNGAAAVEEAALPDDAALLGALQEEGEEDPLAFLAAPNSVSTNGSVMSQNEDGEDGDFHAPAEPTEVGEEHYTAGFSGGDLGGISEGSVAPPSDASVAGSDSSWGSDLSF